MSSWCHFANAFDHDDEVQLNTFISKLSYLFYHNITSLNLMTYPILRRPKLSLLIPLAKLLPSIWKCAEDLTAKMWHRPYGGQLRGRRCLPKGHKPWFTPKYQSGEQDYGQHILPCHFLCQTPRAHRVRLKDIKFKLTSHQSWWVLHTYYTYDVCCFPITLRDVTIDWQGMEGSTYLATERCCKSQ